MEALDKFQQQFCSAPQNNLRLLAPAGCGKTQCILHRCNYLANQSESKKTRFLIVTFTRAARDELKTRINEDTEFSSLQSLAEVTTLNSWGYRRIKRSTFNHRLIQEGDFRFIINNQLRTIWQDHQRVREAITEGNSWRRNQIPKVLMKLLDTFKSLGFDHQRHRSVEDFSHHWQALINQGLGLFLVEQIDVLISHEIVGEPNGHWHSEECMHDVYESFYLFWLDAVQHLFDSAIFTLEDQKYFAHLHERNSFENDGHLYGAASYDHVIIDEFQDINPLDLSLVKAIAERNRATISIVGDDDQAIFEWRGATPEYILNPGSYFDVGFDTYKLGINYRSPANIVSHSQRLIGYNERRIHKDIAAYESKSASIQMLEVSDMREALEYVSEAVGMPKSISESSERIALIGRKRSQLIPYQIYFASREIPFCAAEDLQIFFSKTFERLLELLNIKLDENRRMSSAQVVSNILALCDLVKRYPIKKSERQELYRYLILEKPRNMSAGLHALQEYRGDLKGRNAEGDMSFEMSQAIEEYLQADSITNALEVLSDSFQGLQRDFGRADEDIFFVDPPFFYLADYAARYGNDFEEFVDDIELARDTLAYVPPVEDDVPDDAFRRPLHLMTALRAKGKEFDRVILLDVEDGIWPSRQADTIDGQEAERRLFYVAFTRAKEQITMIMNRSALISPYIGELGLER